MKKTRLTIMALLVCAVMALGVAAGCGSKIAPGEYKPANPSGTQVPPRDSITLDGKLDESIYTDGTLKWIDYTTIGTGDEGLASTAVQVKATTTYGEKGFYLIFDVSHTPVYVDLEHTRPSYIDSCMEVYLGFPGATSLEHNYQIDIAPDGNINVQKHNGAYYMDFYLVDGINAATVKGGEINTPEADGYIMEAYFPWEMFGYDEPLAAIQMDIAVIVSSREDAKGRDGWDQLGLSYNEKCQWANPATYWHWGSNGFEDSDLILSIADYDTEKGSVSFGKTAYKAYEDVEINVAPTAGNILQSIKVNGIDRMLDLNDGKLVLPAYAETQNVKVEAEFIARPTDMVTVSGSVTQKAGLGNMLVDGKQIVFRSGESAFQARVQDGRYTVDLTKGEYTAMLGDSEALTVNVTQSAADQDLDFRYRLFDGDRLNTFADDESYIITGKEGWSDTAIHVGERFVLDYTVQFKDGFTQGSNDDNLAFGYYTEANKHYLFDHYYMEGGWDSLAIRDLGDFWGGTIGDSKGFMGGSWASYIDGVPFRLIRVDDTFYWYIKQGDDFTLMQKHVARGQVTKMSLTIWNENVGTTKHIVFDLKDIAYSDDINVVAIDAQSNDAAMGVVEVKKNAAIDETVTATVRPAEGYVLAQLLVDGSDKTFEIRDNAYTFKADKFAYSIRARFVSATEEAALTGMVTMNKGGATPLPAGTKVTFSGPAEKEVEIGEDGAYSVSLPIGIYTVSSEGCAPKVINVSESGALDLELVYKLFGYDNVNEISEDQTTLITGTSWVDTQLNVDDYFVLDYTVKFKDGFTADSGDDNFAFGYTTTAGRHILFDHYVSGGWDTLAIRDIATFWGTPIAEGKAFNKGNLAAYRSGVPFRLLRAGDNFYWYIKQGDNYTLIHKHTALGEIASMSLTVWGESVGNPKHIVFDLVNIGYTEEMPVAQVTAEYESSMGSVTVSPATVKAGESVTVTCAPTAGYVFEGISVNGVDRTDDVENNVLTFVVDDLTCKIEVAFGTTSQEEFALSGTLTAKAGKSAAWNIPKDTDVTIKRIGTQDKTFTVGENGAYSVKLRGGVYTVSVAGYKPYKLTVTGAETKDLQLVYDLIADSSAAHVSEDESKVTVDAGWTQTYFNVPAATQWVLRLDALASQTAGWQKAAVQFYNNINTRTDFALESNVGDSTSFIFDLGDFPNNGEKDPSTAVTTDLTQAAAKLTVDWEKGYSMAIVRDGNTFTAYLMLDDGKYHNMGSRTIENMTKFCLMSVDPSNVYDNLSLTVGTTQLDNVYVAPEV